MVKESVQEAFNGTIRNISDEVLALDLKILMQDKKINHDTKYIDICRSLKQEFNVLVSLRRIENYFEPDLSVEASDKQLQFENLGIKC